MKSNDLIGASGTSLFLLLYGAFSTITDEQRGLEDWTTIRSPSSGHSCSKITQTLMIFWTTGLSGHWVAELSGLLSFVESTEQERERASVRF